MTDNTRLLRIEKKINVIGELVINFMSALMMFMFWGYCKDMPKPWSDILIVASILVAGFWSQYTLNKFNRLD